MESQSHSRVTVQSVATAQIVEALEEQLSGGRVWGGGSVNYQI